MGQAGRRSKATDKMGGFRMKKALLVALALLMALSLAASVFLCIVAYLASVDKKNRRMRRRTSAGI